MRYRNVFLIAGVASVTAALLMTDPDKGFGTGILLLSIASGVIAVALAHMARKALFDYPEADMRTLFKRASSSATGSGLALIAMAIVISALLGLFGRAHAAQPDPRSAKYLPTVSVETRTHWQEVSWPHFVAGLIAHESGCPGLKSCWSPTAQLKTYREEGAGLGQITRVWRPDGTVYMDSLTDMRNRYPALREWSWANVYSRPDLQIRAVVLMNRGNWDGLRMVADHWERLAMTASAYNGGLGGVNSDRRACQIKAGCDPQKWWGHVEGTCTKSRVVLYGNQTACDINRTHAKRVIFAELPKYKRAM